MSTRDLMEEFYHHMLAREPRADALREGPTQPEAMESRPVLLGAFICQGDPGPLAIQAGAGPLQPR